MNFAKKVGFNFSKLLISKKEKEKHSIEHFCKTKAGATLKKQWVCHIVAFEFYIKKVS
jgi:hypothetical protein